MKTSRWLWLIIALHIVIGLAYDWATPILEASDEGAHFAVVHWLARGNPLPVQDPAAPDPAWMQEGSQPPLYYLLASRLVALVDTSDFDQVFVRNPRAQAGITLTTHNINLFRHPLERQPLAGTQFAVRLTRWFSLLLSCATIFLAYRLALTLFPSRQPLALLTAALVAFNPMALFINASVNNDNLLMLLCTAGLWLTVRLMQRWPKGYIRSALPLGVVLGLGALTKISGLVLWPIVALGVAWSAWRARDVRRFVVSGLLILGPVLAICGWWFWRNYQLYGDLFGLGTMIAIASPRLNPLTLIQLVGSEWQSFWLSYWGVFGGFTLMPAAWVYVFFDILSGAAILGLLYALIRRRGKPARGAEILLLALYIGVTLLSLIRWTLQTLASQGRLMFGAIAPIALFMAIGLLSPWRRWRPYAAMGLTAASVAVAAIIPFAYIAPRYAPPARLSESDLPAALRPLHVQVADGIELIGYVPDTETRRVGEAVAFTLYWRALRPMARDYTLTLHLLGREAMEIGKIDTWPGAGLAPTSSWRAGDILADPYRIQITTVSPTPSLIRLNLSFWYRSPDEGLPFTSPDGAVLNSITCDIGRLTAPNSPPLSTAHLAGSRLADAVTLLGWDYHADALTLYWQTDRPLARDYTVFVHVLDEDGQRIGQADGAPAAGDWPTSAWLPGQPFPDTRALTLPADVGQLTLQIGLYDPNTGQRLRATQPDGSPWPNDAIILEATP